MSLTVLVQLLISIKAYALGSKTYNKIFFSNMSSNLIIKQNENCYLHVAGDLSDFLASCLTDG